MRITSKGQVTIPLEVRRELGLVPGMEVEFEVDGDEARLRRSPKSKTPGELAVESLRQHPGDVDLTTDEIMRMWRGDDWGSSDPR
jgi:AbrB family looped-hinge helix DNA binding protein